MINGARSVLAVVFTVASLWLASVQTGCEQDDELAAEPDSEPGRIRFQIYCAACHQRDGAGTEGGPPPLAGSSWVAGSESRLIRIVLHGVRGAMEVGGETYNLEMPGFGQIFTDAEIASVLSYVRTHLGGSSPPITPASVKNIRAATRGRTAYWTAAELLEMP